MSDVREFVKENAKRYRDAALVPKPEPTPSYPYHDGMEVFILTKSLDENSPEWRPTPGKILGEATSEGEFVVVISGKRYLLGTDNFYTSSALALEAAQHMNARQEHLTRDWVDARHRMQEADL